MLRFILIILATLFFGIPYLYEQSLATETTIIEMHGKKWIVTQEPGEEPMEEVAEEELEENSTTAAQYQKTGFAAGKAGKGGTGYDGKAGKGGTGYDAGSKALQERFQKLANIVKG